MHPLWRIANDWIHRNKTGELDFLKKSLVYCKKIHIRSKSVSEISLHAIKDFFERAIEPKLDRMRQIVPEASLLKISLGSIKSNVLGILNKHNELMLRSSEILFQQQLLEKTVSLYCWHVDDERLWKFKFFILFRSQSSYYPIKKTCHAYGRMWALLSNALSISWRKSNVHQIYRLLNVLKSKYF